MPHNWRRYWYKRRFVSERTFVWIDTFTTLLIRFERKAAYCLGFHHIGFALINLRHVLEESLVSSI